MSTLTAADAATLLDAELSRGQACRLTLEAMAIRERDALAARSESSRRPEVRGDLLRLAMRLSRAFSSSPDSFFNVAVMLDGCEDLGSDVATQKVRLGAMFFTSEALSGCKWRGRHGAGRLAEACGTTVSGLKAAVRQLMNNGDAAPSVAEWLHVIFARLRIIAEVCGNVRPQELEPLFQFASQHAEAIVLSRPATARHPPSDVAVAAVSAAFVTTGFLASQDLFLDSKGTSRACGTAPWPTRPPRSQGDLSVASACWLRLITTATQRSVDDIRACMSCFFVLIGHDG